MTFKTIFLIIVNMVLVAVVGLVSYELLLSDQSTSVQPEIKPQVEYTSTTQTKVITLRRISPTAEVKRLSSTARAADAPSLTPAPTKLAYNTTVYLPSPTPTETPVIPTPTEVVVGQPMSITPSIAVKHTATLPETGFTYWMVLVSVPVIFIAIGLVL